MPKISIIVPVYKAENFLHKCLDSILSQSFEDYELILINDGSPDNSGMICDKYAAEYNRIKVVHQQNKGVSAARNAGIRIAQGEWLCFIDSDDLVSKTYLEDFMKLHSADLLLQGYVTEIQDMVVAEHSLNQEYHCTEDVIVEAEEKQILNSPCFKLFKRSIVAENNLLFDCNTSYGEDHLFTLSYLRFVKTISTSPEKGYHQVIASNESLSHRIVPSDFLFYYIIHLRKSIDELFGCTITPDLLKIYNLNLYNHLRRYLKSFFLLNNTYKVYKVNSAQFRKSVKNYIVGIDLLGKFLCMFYVKAPNRVSYVVFSIIMKSYKRK